MDFFDKSKIENKCLFVCLVFGILCLLITPPFCMPDENAHYLNAYTISKGDIFPHVTDDKSQIGKEVEKNVYDFVMKNRDRFTGKLNEKYNFAEYYFDSWLINKENEKLFYDSTLFSVFPIGYTFSSIGMFLCRLFFKSYATPYNLLICGRIFNLVSYTTIFYIAIKTTPVFKNTMAMISLMPMCLYLGSSNSYDAPLISILVLFFAIVLKLILSDENYILSKKDIFIVLFCAFFMIGIKMVYAPLLLLLFFVPKKKYKNNKKYIYCIISVIIISIIALIPEIVNNIIKSEYIDKNSIYYTSQKEYLFNNIFSVPNIFLNTFKNFYLFYYATFFGNLGNLDTNFPLPILTLGYMMLFIVSFIEATTSFKLNFKIKIVSLCLALICMFGIFMAMYINWTPLPGILGVGADYVSGVQGRYFIPIYLFVFVLFLDTYLKKYDDIVKNICYFVSNLFIYLFPSLTIFSLISRFWI